MNGRDRPLIGMAAIISLIVATRTRTGLQVRSQIDQRTYPKGVRIANQWMAQLDLERHTFYGD